MNLKGAKKVCLIVIITIVAVLLIVGSKCIYTIVKVNKIISAVEKMPASADSIKELDEVKDRYFKISDYYINIGGEIDKIDKEEDRINKKCEIFNQYATNFDDVYRSITGSALMYENICQVIGIKWSIDTPDGISLSVLKYENYLQDCGLYDKLQKDYDSITQKLQKIKNPPNEFQDTYNQLLSMYDSYIQIYKNATNPQGTYNSYYNSVNDTNTKFQELEDKIKVTIPNKK